MDNEKIKGLANGARVMLRVGGRPAGRKFRLFASQGMQSDDIGGYYEEIPEVAGKWVEAVVCDVTGENGKTRRFLRWVGKDGKMARKPIYKVKRTDLMEVSE